MTQDRAQLLITAVDQTRSAFDSIRGTLAKLGNESNRVKGLLAGLGVSLSVAGFAAMIKNAIDAADQLNKLSQKIGNRPVTPVYDLSGSGRKIEPGGASQICAHKGIHGHKFEGGHFC